MTTYSSDEQPETVREIKVQIGKEWAHHHFGREVSKDHAYQFALHFVEVLCGRPSPLTGDQWAKLRR